MKNNSDIIEFFVILSGDMVIQVSNE